MKTVVYSLNRDDVNRLVTKQIRDEILELANSVYDHEVRVRTSPLCREWIDLFWEVCRQETERMASESSPENRYSSHGRWALLKRSTGQGKRGSISYAAYEALHTRVSRVLCRPDAFSLERAMEVARDDWVEDMTSGNRANKSTSQLKTG
jgi:hypothetical protein